MRVLKCRCDAVSDPQDLFWRQRPLLAQHPQIHTVDEREHHVGPIGLEVVIQDVHQVPMLKSPGNARLTDEQLPTLGVFGAVCMQPLEAPPAFGAVVAYPDDLERLSGAADTDASHHLVPVNRCWNP